MLEALKEFWNAISPKVRQAIKEMTMNCIRRERYDVTTPPDGEKIGVKPPYGGEIFLPYAPTVAGATVGQTVLVEWRGSLSTGIATAFGDGIIKSGRFTVTVSTAWSGTGPYSQNISVPGMSGNYNPTPSLVMPETGQEDAMAAFRKIVAVVASDNQVTIFADEPTTTNISVLLKI